MATDNPPLDLGLQLVATAAGAFLGLYFTMWWDKKKDKQDENKKKMELIKILKTEIDGNLQGFSTILYDKTDPLRWDSSSRRFLGKRGKGTTSGFNYAINSGVIRLLPIDTQIKIMELYQLIDHFNLIMDQMGQFYTTSIYALDPAIMEAEHIIEIIEKNADVCIREMKKIKLILDKFT